MRCSTTGPTTTSCTRQLGKAGADAVKTGSATACRCRLGRRKLPAQVVHALADGIAQVFFWSIFLAVLVPVLAFFIQHVTLRGRPDPKAPEGVEPERAEMVNAFE